MGAYLPRTSGVASPTDCAVQPFHCFQSQLHTAITVVFTAFQPWSRMLLLSTYVIGIHVYVSMFRNYSFNFGRNVEKRGRNMEMRRERNIAEPKFELKSFRPSSCVFYGCGHI